MLAIPQLPKQILEFILSKSISTVWIPHRHYPDIARMVLGLVEVCWSGMQVALPYILHRLTHPTYFIYPPYFLTRHAYKPRTPPCQSYVMISIWRVVEWRKYKACCVCWTSQIDWNLEKVRNQVVNTVKSNIVFSFGSFETIKLLNSWPESPTGFNMHACQNADRSRSWAENDTTVKLRKCQKKPNGAAQWQQGTVQQITASSGCEACNWDCAVGCGEKTERGRKLQELLCRWSRSRPSVRSRSISSPIHLSSILDQRSAPLCCLLFLNCCSVAALCTDLLHHKGVERPPHPFSAPSTTSAKSIFSPDTISLPISHGVNT